MMDNVVILTLFCCLVLLSTFFVGCVSEGPETNVTVYNESGPVPSNLSNQTQHVSNVTSVNRSSSATEPSASNIPVDNGSVQNLTVEHLCNRYKGDDYLFCMINRTGNLSLCPDETCIVRFAEWSEDSDVCDTFEHDFDRMFCLSYVTGTDRCRELSPGSLRQFLCYEKLGALTGDPHYCEQIDVDNDYRKRCYTEVAIARADYSICKNLRRSYHRDYCYITYANATGDPTPCDLLFVNSKTPLCYKNAALTAKDPRVCNGIKDDHKRQVCYQTVFNAVDTLDPQVCEGLLDQSWVWACLEYSAVKNNDPKICDEITDPNARARCNNKFI